ncbi:MAG: BMC domain-containing protein [Deltaproteobacteria bacterium]|jgi:microcompartment protein CcmL/EutN|nr:BMC domain-containing protein [Deltaproteobacteria bacterium]
MSADGVALGIIELEHIARGLLVSDAVLKKAPITILRSTPVSGGKYLVFLRGGVAEIEESMAAGRDVGGSAIVDSLLLPFAADQLWEHMPTTTRGSNWAGDVESESVAIVETRSVCAAVHGADAAVKCAPVTLRDMQLAVGISGKAFFTMTGRLFDVEAAAEAAREVAGDRVLDLQLIAQPADEIRGRLIIP